MSEIIKRPDSFKTLPECLQYEINRIEDKYLKEDLISYFLVVVPDYFWTKPASSTGKYHPDQDNVEGGLVNHTCMVAEIAATMLDLDMFADLRPYYNEIYAACLLHDTWKYGIEVNGDKYTHFDHPLLSSQMWIDYCKDKGILGISERKIADLISTHHGQWTTSSYSDIILPECKGRLAHFVHLCDYLAAQRFIGNLNFLFNDK